MAEDLDSRSNHHFATRRKTRRFADQSFRSLNKRSADCGLTFTDDHFHQQDRSVFHSAQYRHQLDIGKLEWRRPRDFRPEGDLHPPVLISKSSGTGSLAFSGTGPNQWFIAAALAVSEHRALFDPLVHRDETAFRDHGIAKFTIWHAGWMHKVVVDDKLPANNNNTLVFARPVINSEQTSGSWWLPLLEKAYAKLYGSYETMALSGSLHTALVDLSGGGVVETLPIQPNLVELISKEYQAKSLLIFRSKDFRGKGPFGVKPSQYYLVRGVKRRQVGSLKRFMTHGSPLLDSEDRPILVTSTLVDPASNRANQEIYVQSNSLGNLFDTLTICRAPPYNRDQLHQLRAKVSKKESSSSSSFQFSFDVVASDPTSVLVNLVQRSTNPPALGFRIYAIELNRKFKVHKFSALKLITTVDPRVSRTVAVRLPDLPYGRYLLLPVCPSPITGLVVSIFAEGVANLRQLSQDMPRYQLTRFLPPSYPLCATRIVVHRAEGLEPQDRFGSANPYCIIRCAKKHVKSTHQMETLSPNFSNLSAIFYHRRIQPITIEIWHRSLLMNSCIGLVQLIPKQDIPLETFDSSSLKPPEEEKEEEVFSDSKECEPDSNGTLQPNSNSNTIRKLPLTDRKGLEPRPGFVHFEAVTVENLKFF